MRTYFDPFSTWLIVLLEQGSAAIGPARRQDRFLDTLP